MTRAVARWIVGAGIGTLLIAVTSPAFVRSYLPRQRDPVRGVEVFLPGHSFRWRSEGYATTWIGPLGMPGVRPRPLPETTSVRVALWGDSQAEGACVVDEAKVFAVSERLSADLPRPIRMYPLARSGDDAADWLLQMPRVEAHLQLDAHALLVVDLPDLAAVSAASLDAEQGDLAASGPQWLTQVPAFVIQAARHLLTEPDNTTPRRLRFAVGPTVAPEPLSATSLETAPSNIAAANWSRVFTRLRHRTQLPIMLVYAPPVPHIAAGRIVHEDPWQTDFAAMMLAADEHNITLIDVRTAMLRSADQGRWPWGFHNGQIGSGHLNATGNELIARALVAAVQQLRRGS